MANELQRSKRIVIKGKYHENILPENSKLLSRFKTSMTISNRSKDTIYNYERDLMQWFAFICQHQNNRPIANTKKPGIYDANKECIDVDDLEEFLYFCQQEGNNANRINRRCASISSFYRFLKRKQYYIGDNPMDLIQRPKRGRPVVVQTFLSLDQIDQIRTYLAINRDLQYSVLFEVGLATMARVNALSNLTFSCCDLNEMVFNDVLEKEQKIVQLMFNERVRSLLIRWQNLRQDKGINCDYIFITRQGRSWGKASVSTLQNWISKIGWEAIGVALHPHDLRHSGATLLKNAGMSLEEVSRLLNHESTDVTQKFYIKEDNKKLGQRYRQFSI